MTPVISNKQYDETLNRKMFYQEILSILNRFDSRKENTVSFVVILIVVLFLGYMAVYFGMAEGFILKIQRDLFVIIVGLFYIKYCSTQK